MGKIIGSKQAKASLLISIVTLGLVFWFAFEKISPAVSNIIEPLPDWSEGVLIIFVIIGLFIWAFREDYKRKKGE